ncbi:MAG: DUF3786 domain-containing protein [Candidatus Geothermincolales bacterium]
MGSEEEKKVSPDPFAEPSNNLRGRDPLEVAESAGLIYEEGHIRLPVYRWEIMISHPDLRFEGPPFLTSYVMRLLSLIYLSKAQAKPLANQWVPYRELKDGLFYVKSFQETVEERLLSRFSEDLDALREAAVALGGRVVEQGDLGVVIPTFPRLPLLMIIWKGDEEFPSSARILFDRSADTYLNAFELRMLSGEVVGHLVKIADGVLELPG